MPKQPAFFFDRDGTLIQEKNYLSDLSDIAFFPSVAQTLKRITALGYKLIVITNQSGVARGYFNEEFVQKVHRLLNQVLEKDQIQIDDFFYCPHHPSEGNAPYVQDCKCRKPNPGLIFEAQKKYDLDLENSYMVGDKLCDIQLAKNAGVNGVFVRTGTQPKDEEKKIIGLGLTPLMISSLNELLLKLIK